MAAGRRSGQARPGGKPQQQPDPGFDLRYAAEQVTSHLHSQHVLCLHSTTCLPACLLASKLSVSVCLSVCLSACLPACLSVCLSGCLSVHLCVCLSVCLSISYVCLPIPSPSPPSCPCPQLCQQGKRCSNRHLPSHDPYRRHLFHFLSLSPHALLRGPPEGLQTHPHPAGSPRPTTEEEVG